MISLERNNGGNNIILFKIQLCFWFSKQKRSPGSIEIIFQGYESCDIYERSKKLKKLTIFSNWKIYMRSSAKVLDFVNILKRQISLKNEETIYNRERF